MVECEKIQNSKKKSENKKTKGSSLIKSKIIKIPTKTRQGKDSKENIDKNEDRQSANTTANKHGKKHTRY